MGDPFVDNFPPNRREREERERREERFRRGLSRDRDDRDRPYFSQEHPPLQIPRGAPFSRNSNRQRSPVDYEDMDRSSQGIGMSGPFGERRGLVNGIIRNNNPDIDVGFLMNDRERKYAGERFISSRESRFRPGNNPQFSSGQGIGGHREYYQSGSGSSFNDNNNGSSSNNNTINSSREFMYRYDERDNWARGSPFSRERERERERDREREYRDRERDKERERGERGREVHREFRDPLMYRTNNIPPSHYEREGHEFFYREREYPRHRYRDWDIKEDLYRRSGSYTDKSKDDYLNHRFDKNISRGNSADSEKSGKILSLAARHNHWRERGSRHNRRSTSSSSRSSNSSRSPPPVNRRPRSLNTSTSRSSSPQPKQLVGTSRESSPHRPDLERLSSKPTLKFYIPKLSEKNNETGEETRLELEEGEDIASETGHADDQNTTRRDSLTTKARSIAMHDDVEFVREVCLRNSLEPEENTNEEKNIKRTGMKNSNDRGGWTGWHSIEGGNAATERSEVPNEFLNDSMDNSNNESDRSLEIVLSPREQEALPSELNDQINENDPDSNQYMQSQGNKSPEIHLDKELQLQSGVEEEEEEEEEIVEETVVVTSDTINLLPATSPAYSADINEKQPMLHKINDDADNPAHNNENTLIVENNSSEIIPHRSEEGVIVEHGISTSQQENCENQETDIFVSNHLVNTSIASNALQRIDVTDEEMSERVDFDQIIEKVEEDISIYQGFLKTIENKEPISEHNKKDSKTTEKEKKKPREKSSSSTPFNKNLLMGQESDTNSDSNIRDLTNSLKGGNNRAKSTDIADKSCSVKRLTRQNSIENMESYENQENHIHSKDDSLREKKKLPPDSGKRSLSLWELIYNENRILSQENDCPIEITQIFYTLNDYPVYRKNMIDHALLRPNIITKYLEKNNDLEKKELALKRQYKLLYESWTQKNEKLQKLNEKKKKFDKSETIAGPSTEDKAINRTAMVNRVYRRGDAVRSEAELTEVIKDLEAAELRNPEKRARRTLATIPPMIIENFLRENLTFDDRNRLVLNADLFYSVGREATAEWTPEEIELFKSVYAEYPKQFGKIAELIGNKTTNQCVEFYYLNKKKQIDFKVLITGKGNAKKRKGAGRRRTITGANASSPPTPDLLSTRKRNKTSFFLDDIGSTTNSLRKTKEKDDIRNPELTEKLEGQKEVQNPIHLSYDEQELQQGSRSQVQLAPPDLPVGFNNLNEGFQDNRECEQSQALDLNTPIVNPLSQTDTVELIEKSPKHTSRSSTPPIDGEWSEDEQFLFQFAMSEVTSQVDRPRKEGEDYYNHLSENISINNDGSEIGFLEDSPGAPPPGEEEFTIAPKKSKIIKIKRKSKLAKPADEEQEKGKRRKNTRAKKDTSKVLDDEKLEEEANGPIGIDVPSEGFARTSSKGEDKNTPPRYSSYWSVKEKERYEELLKLYQKDWSGIAQALGTKTSNQVRNYYMKGVGNQNLLDDPEPIARLEDIDTKDGETTTPTSLDIITEPACGTDSSDTLQTPYETQQISVPHSEYVEEETPLTAHLPPTSPPINSSADIPLDLSPISSPSTDINRSVITQIPQETSNNESSVVVIENPNPPQGKRTILDLLNPITETETIDDAWFDGEQGIIEQSQINFQSNYRDEVTTNRSNSGVDVASIVIDENEIFSAAVHHTLPQASPSEISQIHLPSSSRRSSNVQLDSQQLQQQHIHSTYPAYNLQQIQEQLRKSQPTQQRRQSVTSRPQLSYYTPPASTNMNTIQTLNNQHIYGMMPTNPNLQGTHSPNSYPQAYIDHSRALQQVIVQSQQQQLVQLPPQQLMVQPQPHSPQLLSQLMQQQHHHHHRLKQFGKQHSSPPLQDQLLQSQQQHHQIFPVVQQEQNRRNSLPLLQHQQQQQHLQPYQQRMQQIQEHQRQAATVPTISGEKMIFDRSHATTANQPRLIYPQSGVNFGGIYRPTPFAVPLNRNEILATNNGELISQNNTQALNQQRQSALQNQQMLQSQFNTNSLPPNPTSTMSIPRPIPVMNTHENSSVNNIRRSSMSLAVSSMNNHEGYTIEHSQLSTQQQWDRPNKSASSGLSYPPSRDPSSF
ncbi:hypothetical protein G9A89_014941 [Geosiphon pyriformis]|nr:hypothetical protein G9A89_014941 [Geosiphon pyriformis]